MRAVAADDHRKTTHPEVRFWRLVDRSGGPDACWLWIGATSQKGSDRYGSFRTDAGMVPAHRFALGTTGVDLSNVPEVMHECDTPLCCNIRHLIPGNKLLNMQDCARKGRLKFCRCGRRRLQHSGQDHVGPSENPDCTGFVAKGAL